MLIHTTDTALHDLFTPFLVEPRGSVMVEFTFQDRLSFRLNAEKQHAFLESRIASWTTCLTGQDVPTAIVSSWQLESVNSGRH
jgi:hypothetical protein